MIGRSCRVLTAVLLAATAMAVCRVTHGQCEVTLPPLGFPGASGPVHALATWDPDGPGPSPELLIAGGEFDAIGGIGAGHTAAWDGTAWRGMGTVTGWDGGDWPWAVRALGC